MSNLTVEQFNKLYDYSRHCSGMLLNMGYTIVLTYEDKFRRKGKSLQLKEIKNKKILYKANFEFEGIELTPDNENYNELEARIIICFYEKLMLNKSLSEKKNIKTNNRSKIL